MVLQPHKVSFSLLPLKDDSANFTITMSYWSYTILYTASSNRASVMAPNKQCKFHALFTQWVTIICSKYYYGIMQDFPFMYRRS